jgi:hypothetical protein
MYLATFKPEYKTDKPTILWQGGRAAQGPINHVELVWYHDGKADALMVTAECKDGFPRLILKRLFHSKKRTQTYKIQWYLFKSTYEQRMKARIFAEKIVASEEYKMSMIRMMGSSLPSFMRPLYKPLYKILLGTRKDYVMEYDDAKPIYCVSLTKMVLEDTFPNLKLTESNATELVAILLRHGLIEAVEPPNIEGDSQIDEEGLITRAEEDDYLYYAAN